jgi:hypothetical protein
MRENWSVTYQKWTPDDIEAGETRDLGFVEENCTFKDAIKAVGGQYAYYEPDCYPHTGVRWLTNSKYDECFRTGDIEERSLHIPDQITEASRMRIMRYLGVKGI